MKRILVSAFAILAVVALCQMVAGDSKATVSSNAEPGSTGEIVQQGLVMERMDLMPLAFTENKGQWDERVKFRANAGGATMWFTEDGVYYQFTRRISMSGGRQTLRQAQDSVSRGCPKSVYPVDESGALVIPVKTGIQITSSKTLDSRFRGNDNGGAWSCPIRHFQSFGTATLGLPSNGETEIFKSLSESRSRRLSIPGTEKNIC